MEPGERLEIAARAIEEFNPVGLSVLEEMNAEELAKIAADYDIKATDYSKTLSTLVYIRKRIIEKKSRAISFTIAFPGRSIATEHDKVEGFSKTTSIGETLSKSTLEVKARRVEASALFKHLYQVVQLNLYTTYAVDRMRILDSALASALDPMVSDRDRAPYMKIFLEETRKPENAKGLELNLNINSGGAQLQDIEAKMDMLASKIVSQPVSAVIDMIHQPRDDDDIT